MRLLIIYYICLQINIIREKDRGGRENCIPSFLHIAYPVFPPSLPSFLPARGEGEKWPAYLPKFPPTYPLSLSPLLLSSPPSLHEKLVCGLSATSRCAVVCINEAAHECPRKVATFAIQQYTYFPFAIIFLLISFHFYQSIHELTSFILVWCAIVYPECLYGSGNFVHFIYFIIRKHIYSVFTFGYNSSCHLSLYRLHADGWHFN